MAPFCTTNHFSLYLYYAHLGWQGWGVRSNHFCKIDVLSHQNLSKFQIFVVCTFRFNSTLIFMILVGLVCRAPVTLTERSHVRSWSVSTLKSSLHFFQDARAMYVVQLHSKSHHDMSVIIRFYPMLALLVGSWKVNAKVYIQVEFSLNLYVSWWLSWYSGGDPDWMNFYVQFERLNPGGSSQSFLQFWNLLFGYHIYSILSSISNLKFECGVSVDVVLVMT